MKHILLKKHCAARTLKRLLAVILAGAMVVLLCSCAGQQTVEIEPVTVERAPGPVALQTANAGTALALRYYIYARLKTEALIDADLTFMSAQEFESLVIELASIWNTADALLFEAETIADEAIRLLKESPLDQTANAAPRPKVTTFSGNTPDFSVIPLAANSGREVDPETWAENLTKQYDALRGAQRYKQLAQQLGTDTKTAIEQMEIAQKIMHNIAYREEAQAEAGEYSRCVNTLEVYKTSSKVGLFVGATIATGGGSLASLAGSSMTLGQAGAVIVSGVDCIVDVGKTTSTIVLGENHRVTMDFQEAGDVLQPLSMVMGLAVMNPSDTVEQIAFVGEALMEWFYPGKITGIAVEKTKDLGEKLIAQIVDSAESKVPGTKKVLGKVLEMFGINPPAEKGVSVSDLLPTYTVNSETALATMQALAAQMAQQTGGGIPEDMQPQQTDPLAPEDEPSSEEPQQNTTGAITPQDMAGNWSGVATLQHIEEDVEAPDSLPVTLQLNEAGTGTVNVNGYGGEAQYAGSSVVFSVAMKEDGAAISCVFRGRASRNSGQIVINGDMRFSMMGITFASYTWTAQK